MALEILLSDHTTKKGSRTDLIVKVDGGFFKSDKYYKGRILTTRPLTLDQVTGELLEKIFNSRDAWVNNKSESAQVCKLHNVKIGDVLITQVTSSFSLASENEAKELIAAEQKKLQNPDDHLDPPADLPPADDPEPQPGDDDYKLPPVQ